MATIKELLDHQRLTDEMVKGRSPKMATVSTMENRVHRVQKSRKKRKKAAADPEE